MKPYARPSPCISAAIWLRLKSCIRSFCASIRKASIPAIFLGVLRAQQGKTSEARSLMERALALRPGDPAMLASYGKLQMQLGDFAGAQKTYAQALAAKPGSPDLLYARGNAEREAGQLAAADASYLAAIKAQPNFADAYCNRGAVLQLMGRPGDALANLDRAIALAPNHARAWNNRATLLADQHRLPEAIDSASRAIAAQPNFAEAFANRGSARWQLHQTSEALADFNQALAINPDLTSALSNRARLLWSERRDFEPARRDLEHLLKRDPNFPLAKGDLFYVRASIGDWMHFDADVASLTRATDAGELAVQPFIYQACATSSASLLANARTYASREYPPRPPLTLQPASGKIRLGYVCGEFRGHATSYLSVGLFEQHDRSRFDVIGFDNGTGDDSPTRARLEKAFDPLISIKDLSDEQAARRIAEERIDILVNLNGYYGDHRMGVFAHRPAPVQVNWLGFPGTLGASTIDYIIADKVVLPEAEQSFYTEQVAWLPGSYQINDNRRATSPRTPARAEAGLPDDAFVFCNFNQPYKLSPAMLKRWLAILTRVPGSVLWLWSNNSAFEANIKRFAGAQTIGGGVDPARIIIAPPMAQPDHLARLALADLFLDSLPYNAHTTASDALWAGVPLLTCTGATFAGRVATSLLMAANLPELITTTVQDYEDRAVALANDRQALRVLRARLSHQRDSCALFDTQAFTHHLELAFTTMANAPAQVQPTIFRSRTPIMTPGGVRSRDTMQLSDTGFIPPSWPFHARALALPHQHAGKEEEHGDLSDPHRPRRS